MKKFAFSDTITGVMDSNGTLVISGKGGIPSFSAKKTGCFGATCNPDIRRVVIHDGITRIGGDAFACCENLESVVLPNSVTSIAGNAFYLCEKLAEINLGAVRYINDYAFWGCDCLGDEDGNIPFGVKGKTVSIGRLYCANWR